MNKDLALLNYICQNAEMGKNTITQLTGIVEDVKMRRLLEEQLAEYQTVFNAAEEQIHAQRAQVKGLGALAKISTYMMINLNTLTDKSQSHIAEMMMQGSNMGIIDITRELRRYPDASAEVVKLGNKLLKIEQRNLDELKAYL